MYWVYKFNIDIFFDETFVSYEMIGYDHVFLNKIKVIIKHVKVDLFICLGTDIKHCIDW